MNTDIPTVYRQRGMSGTPGLALIDWWVEQARLRMAVINAARAYSEFTHGNLTQPRYGLRQEARDALLDALEALDEAEARQSGIVA